MDYLNTICTSIFKTGHVKSMPKNIKINLIESEHKILQFFNVLTRYFSLVSQVYTCCGLNFVLVQNF